MFIDPELLGGIFDNGHNIFYYIFKSSINSEEKNLKNNDMSIHHKKKNPKKHEKLKVL